MDTNFGYQDFILVNASQEDVLRAIVEDLKSAAEDDFQDAPMPLMAIPPRDPEAREAFEAAHPASHLMPKTLVGAVLSMLGIGRRRRIAAYEAAMADFVDDMPVLDAYSMHLGTAEPITRVMPPAYGPGEPEALNDDVQVSAIAGSEWTLVEYTEQVSGMSMLGFQLSMALESCDVLYFRRSGTLAIEPHFDFHLYRDGDTVRRVLCHCTHPNGDPAQAWWEAIADRPQTRYEPSSVYAGAVERDLLTDARIETILGTIGLSFAKLFGAEQRCNSVLLSRRPGGAPLSVAA